MAESDYGVLNIGTRKDDEKEWVSLDDNSRRANLAIYGIKNTGKAHTITPFLFRQDVQRKSSGITFVVNTPQLAFELYTIGKHSKRKVEILKPSVNFNILNKLLFAEKWDYEVINNEIIDYKQAINNADIVIIDMEQEKYGMHAVKATAMLLMQLQTDMSEIEETNKRRHYVYIDDAATFLPYMTSLLKYGEMFNISSTFFFNSRSEFKQEKDYTSLVDNNVRNYILLQGINYDDAQYFAQRMNLDKSGSEDAVQQLLNRQYGEFAYEILLPKTFIRETGLGRLVELPAEERESIATNAKRHRKSLLKKMQETIMEKHMQMSVEESMLQELSDKLNVGKDSTMMNKLETEVTKTLEQVESSVERQIDKELEADEEKSTMHEFKVEEDAVADTEPDFADVDESVLEPVIDLDVKDALENLDNVEPEEPDPTSLLDGINIPSITNPSKGPYDEEIDKNVEAEPLAEIQLGANMNPEEFSLVNEPEEYQDIEVENEKVENPVFDLVDDDGPKKKHYYPYQRIRNKSLENEVNKLWKN